MIYLITGNMGTGKTSRAVNMILTNEDGLFSMKLEDGTVIVNMIYFSYKEASHRQYRWYGKASQRRMRNKAY